MTHRRIPLTDSPSHRRRIEVPKLKRNDILDWLRQEDDLQLDKLRQQADSVRRRNVGDAVHLRVV